MAAGGALLYAEVTGATVAIGRYWPAGLVLLGLELLVTQIAASAAGDRVRIGWGSSFTILLILVACASTTFGDVSCGQINFAGIRESASEIRPVPADFTGIARLKIVTRFGGVRILAVPEGKTPRITAEVVAEAATAEKARAELSNVSVTVETVAGTLTVTVRGETGDAFRQARADLDLLILPDLEVEVESGFGDVEIEGLLGPAIIDTAFGDVALRELAGPVTVRTQFGDLDATDLSGPASYHSEHGKAVCEQTTGPLDLVTAHGSITIRLAQAEVKARSTYAAVSVYFETPPPVDCEVRSTHGAATVEVPGASPLTVDLLSEHASVRTDFGLPVTKLGTRSQAAGDINGGGPRMVVRSVYASVSLRAR
jgi:hypothetical protein